MCQDGKGEPKFSDNGSQYKGPSTKSSWSYTDTIVGMQLDRVKL